jgi:hypothetical protein
LHQSHQTCSKELALAGLPYEIKKSLVILLQNLVSSAILPTAKKEIYGFAKNERSDTTLNMGWNSKNHTTNYTRITQFLKTYQIICADEC